jgi:hypothetical protein
LPQDKKLIELIEKYKSQGRRGGVDWLSVGSDLDRGARDCCTRWRALNARKLKMGPYTAEEVRGRALRYVDF